MTRIPPSAQHSSFTIERTLPGRPTHAWRFWADPGLKQRWNGCHPDWTQLDLVQAFEIGGRDLSRMRSPDGVVHTVEMHYLDLLAPQRIVYAYTMHVDATPLSASLVTIELLPDGERTGMVYTEHLTMLDGDAAQRVAGTGHGLDRLVLEMERSLATVQ